MMILITKKVIKNILGVLIFSLIALPAIAHGYKLGSLEIIHPWTRPTLAGTKSGGGYLSIINHGNTPDRLISVSANGVQTTELHSMTVVNDIMKMEKIPNGIEIPGNGEVTLKPGGNHVMFMGISQPFKLGDKINAKLTFEKAGTIDIYFYVNTEATYE
ncbi:copper chaperone PCu(A)C [Bartonella sp. CB60]|uniref:copper chaperone PCu(A)C n=2 Tax=unclassified Bartonella TaxID=2645622 RepID=UPI00300E6A0B